MEQVQSKAESPDHTCGSYARGPGPGQVWGKYQQAHSGQQPRDGSIPSLRFTHRPLPLKEQPLLPPGVRAGPAAPPVPSTGHRSAPRVHGTHFSGVPTGAQNKPVSLTPSYGPTGCPLGSKEHLPVTPAPLPALEPWHTLFCQEHRPPCWPPVPHLRACPRPPVLCPIPTLTLHRTGQPDAIPTSCI